MRQNLHFTNQYRPEFPAINVCPGIDHSRTIISIPEFFLRLRFVFWWRYGRTFSVALPQASTITHELPQFPCWKDVWTPAFRSETQCTFASSRSVWERAMFAIVQVFEFWRNIVYRYARYNTGEILHFMCKYRVKSVFSKGMLVPSPPIGNTCTFYYWRVCKILSSFSRTEHIRV